MAAAVAEARAVEVHLYELEKVPVAGATQTSLKQTSPIIDVRTSVRARGGGCGASKYAPWQDSFEQAQYECASCRGHGR